MADLSDRIEALANGPASASVGDRSASAQSVASAIEADKYLAGKAVQAAGINPLRMLKRSKAIPPSSLGS